MGGGVPWYHPLEETLCIQLYMYMKIHVSSLLAIGVDKHTHTINKQAATMASLNIRAATLA